MSYYAPYATTQPSWIKDMMTHVQADRMSEFSTSGSGDSVSVYWEPVSSFTDPSKTHSPTDTILPPALSLKNLSTLPSSPIGSPSAQPHMRLGDTEVSHEFKSSVLTTVPTNEEKRSHTSRTHHRGAPLEQLQTLKQLSNNNIVGVCIGQAEEGNRSIQAEASCVGGGVIQARACCTTSAGQTCKSKIKDIDAKHDIDQENIDKPVLVETRKHICWEKTGTDWQTVLNINKYSEQGSEQSQMEDMKTNI
ncbi:hypothetical protein EDB19DRAFT_1916167 [Suillus lakei]|nr:hypothetical protein EDB19DRAFT_1916167 [Suillus lakei]